MTFRYRQVEKAAGILGVTVQPLGVREPDDFETAFATMTRGHQALAFKGFFQRNRWRFKRSLSEV